MITKLSSIELDDPPSMYELAKMLDLLLNPDGGPRKEGFLLLRFRQGEVDRPRFAASCDTEHAIRLLKLLTAHLEGRITGKEGNA